MDGSHPLTFESESVAARFISPDGTPVETEIEIRRHPLTGRTCRIAYSRIGEREAGADALPGPPPDALNAAHCPFCRPQVLTRTPTLRPGLAQEPRMQRGASLLFPNLFPYGAYSAVSLFDDRHFAEIGTATAGSYRDCLLNCVDYLTAVCGSDPDVRYMAITQNHLPSAGGSLVHPHLQVNADRVPANHQHFLRERCRAYRERTGRLLLSDYLGHEEKDGSRMIGRSGPWHWMSAFAPEGFFEIWAILPGVTRMGDVDAASWAALAEGIIYTQKLYRSLNRNGYNLGLMLFADPDAAAELRVVLMVRANYAPWVRNDHTGFEVMLGDMATFTPPEETARLARPFWEK